MQTSQTEKAAQKLEDTVAPDNVGALQARQDEWS